MTVFSGILTHSYFVCLTSFSRNIMLKRMINVKRHIVRTICILFLVNFCLCLSGCSRHSLKIDAEQAEKVTLYHGEMSVEYLENRKDGVELDHQSTKKFIQLFLHRWEILSPKYRTGPISDRPGR